MQNSTCQLIIKDLGQQDYDNCWQAMQTFTHQRTSDTTDELWLLEHNPVFTQGPSTEPQHLLDPQEIPVITVDRGGQITYHGPGQLVAYVLFDLKRLHLKVSELVAYLEQAVIKVLNHYHINAYSSQKARGIYVNKKKICSIGLKIKRGCSYHGLAFNINLSLAPFERIHPCGYEGLVMTRLCDLTSTPVHMEAIKQQLAHQLCADFNYKKIEKHHVRTFS